MTTSAGCICGKVRMTIGEDVTNVGACHCSVCRRWSGGPAIATHLKSPPKIDGEDNITWYRSSDWAERGFCKHCGSNLFYRLTGDAEMYVVYAGALDDQSALKMENQIFIEEKPDYYAFAGDIPAMTGEEVFAAYAEGHDGDNPREEQP